MSVVYSELKAAEESRQNKYSQAIKKASLEQAQPGVLEQKPVEIVLRPAKPTPSRILFLKYILLPFVVLLMIIAGAFFFLKKPVPPVQNTVKPQVKLVKSHTAKHKTHHKKILHPSV